jgi:hypothetical protein
MYYEGIIQKVQDELALPVCSFPNVGMTALSFMLLSKFSCKIVD